MSRITLFLSPDKHHIPTSPPFFTHGFLNFIFFGSVEIPDLTSIPEIHDEPVFDGYRKGGCLLSPKDGGLVKMVVRPFSECDEGTRENNQQIIF